MAVEPTNKLKLLKCPLTLDNKNQLTFASKQAQFEYFNSLDSIEVDEITYQRKDSLLYFEANIDSLVNYNYCMYQNEDYGNKWFYAFIGNMRYIAEETTEIELVTDVFQTWQFDLNWKETFIEREMLSVTDDVPGVNLLPEGLEIGEMKVMANVGFSELEPVCCVAFTGEIIGSREDSPIQPAIQISQDGAMYNGIPSSITFIICRLNALPILLNAINYDGSGDKIIDVFTIPKLAVNSALPSETPSAGNYPFAVLPYSFKENAVTKILNGTPTQLDGYTPRNRKT